MHDYFFCKKRSPYMPLLESYTIILFPDVSRQHLNAKSSIFCKQPISFQKCQNCAIFVLKFPFDNNVVFAHFQIKTQITEILTLHDYFSLHDYFDFENGQPYTIIPYCTVIRECRVTTGLKF